MFVCACVLHEVHMCMLFLMYSSYVCMYMCVCVCVCNLISLTRYLSPNQIGVDFATKNITWDESTNIRLQFWDLAGQ